MSVVEEYGVWDTAMHIFKYYGSDICDQMLESPQLKKLVKSSRKYDLVVVELYGSDCMLGFADIFGAPIVAVLGDEMVPWASDRMGNPENPSYMPHYLLPFESGMSLQNRVLNAFTGLAYKVG